MALLNGFKLGADPEFVIYKDGHMFQARLKAQDKYAPFGFDHAGWVVEPHPKPDCSVRNLITNLRTAFNDFAASCATDGKWRAGAYLQTPERTITLGGHVHVDQPKPTQEQLNGLDMFTRHLEALDIIPKEECERRRMINTGYGKYGDVRTEHGHFEYRTMPSWLYSQRATKLCLIGVKVAACEPKVVLEELGTTARYATVPKLKGLFERFKGKDDDVDWLLNSGMLDKKLEMKPDRDLRDVWAVTPEKEKPHWKAEAEKEARLRADEFVRLGNEGIISPFVVEAAGWYAFRYMAPAYQPLIREKVALAAAIRRRATVWIGTELEAVNNNYRIVGQEDGTWEPYVALYKTYRTQVAGVRYRWRLLLGQVVNEKVREILREAVVNGWDRNDGCLYLIDGLLFQCMGQEGI